MNKKKISVRAIQAIVALSDTAKEFLESLAERQKNRKETTVDQVMSKHRARRRDVIDMFRAMEEAGLGRFVVGRREQRSRFVWSTGMIDVGQAALGHRADIFEIDEEEFEDDEDDPEFCFLSDATIDQIVGELKRRGAKSINFQF